MLETIKNKNELEFVIFCIESIATRKNRSATFVYDVLNENNMINEYIVHNFDILHTQDKDYIVDDILDTLKEKGVTL